MMNPEDHESAEEVEAVPSDMFDSDPSPVSGLGGWATGAGSALFAVTKVKPQKTHAFFGEAPIRSSQKCSSMEPFV